jgi:lysophospholipase L1-like esterase
MKKRVRNGVIFVVIIAILSSLAYIYLKNKEIERQIAEHQQMIKHYYDNKVAQFEEENKSIIPGETDVVFLGDSLTDGCDLSLYYPEYTTLNRGIGGDTTIGLEKRLDVSAYAVKPKVVVMLIGANNLSTMFDNYENILLSMKENLPDSKIVLVSLTSMGDDWGKNNNLAAFNNVKIKALAEKYGYEFVDVYTPLLNLETNEIYENYTTDGGHLTHEGYLVLTGEIKVAIDRVMTENSQEK